MFLYCSARNKGPLVTVTHSLQTTCPATLFLRLAPALLPRWSPPRWMWWKPGTWTHRQASTRAPSTAPGPCWPKRGPRRSTKGEPLLSDPSTLSRVQGLFALEVMWWLFFVDRSLFTTNLLFLVGLCPRFWGWDRGTLWCLCHSNKSREPWWSPRRGSMPQTESLTENLEHGWRNLTNVMSHFSFILFVLWWQRRKSFVEKGILDNLAFILTWCWTDVYKYGSLSLYLEFFIMNPFQIEWEWTVPTVSRLLWEAEFAL